MKNAAESDWHSIWQLVRFLFCYAVAVAGVFYLLPMAGLFLEDSYEALGRVARLLAVIGFVVAIAAWQVLAARQRWQRSADRGKAA